METPRSIPIMVVACALIVGLYAAAPGRIIYVDDDATGAGDGSSWEGAFAHLQDALTAAEAGDEIRVAQGLYNPDQGAGVTPGDRQASFYLVSGVPLAGGFAGLSGADPDERDIERFETILSGDLKGDDGPDFTNIGDNSVIVIRSLGNDATTTLEGFEITGAWGGGRQGGAGILCLGSDIQIANCTIARNKTGGAGTNGAGVSNVDGNPVLTNCVFAENFAWGDGGGFWSTGGYPTFVDCLFEANTAEHIGGGLCLASGGLTLERCTFRQNQAFDGAGLSAQPEIDSECTACEFVDNAAWHALHENLSSGGGAALGRGGYLAPVGTMTFQDCHFEGNSAGDGGALSCGNGIVSIVDCAFHLNTARRGGGAIANHDSVRQTGPGLEPESHLVVTHCAFTENVASRGGALDNLHSAPTLTDCTFRSNVADGTGGGLQGGGAVYTRSGFSRGGGTPVEIAPTFLRCRFIANRPVGGIRGTYGGGLYNDNSATRLVHCLFAGNVANNGGGVYSRGAGPTLRYCTFAQNYDALMDETGGTLLDHCIVWGDAANGVSGPVLALYSDIVGGWPGEGNIDVDPLFAAPGHWKREGDVWIDGDYHLKSQAGRWDPGSESWVLDDVTSPCIDVGDPKAPIGEEPVPNGGIVNLGVYGGTSEASKSYLGDPVPETHVTDGIKGDGKIDLAAL